MEARQMLISLSLKYKNNWGRVYAAIKNREEVAEELNSKYDCITIIDDQFPKEIIKGYKSPFVIYYEGDITKLSDLSGYVYLIGENKFNINEEHIITTDKDNVIHVGTTLKLWSDKRIMSHIELD